MCERSRVSTSSLRLYLQFHQERRMKRKGDRYSIHTSLIVASVKRLLPVGLRACFPNEQNLIMLGKSGFTQVGWKMRPNQLLCVCVGLIPTVLLFQFHSSHLRSCCLKRFYIFDVILVIKVLLFVLSFFCSLCLLHPWIFRPFC